MIEIPDRDKFPSFAQKHMASGELAVGSAYQSYNLGRSTNTATILLLGMTGAGKSHTINNLFTKVITPVGDGASCTKDIAEFTIKMPSEHLGMSNAKIQVIDTPGFGDTEDGLEFDARVLANIDRFFEKKQYKPSFIILAVNINDKRLDGKFAPFVQLLQSMKRQLSKNVLDTKSPNLVIVLTHLAGALPKLQRDPSPKKLLVQKIVHENLGLVDVPVEVAENCIDDYELEKNGDYFVLPNKELFPRNLYQSMVRIAKGADPIGHGIVNEAYPKLQKGNYPITKNIIPIVEVPASDVIVSEILRMKISTNTELGDNLAHGWSQLSPTDRSLSRMEPTELSQKLSILGYKNRTDLPKTKKDVITFFREVAPDKGMEILLRKSLGLEAPIFTVDLYIGRAFDLTKDRTTSFVVLSPGSQVLASVGCYMPDCVIASCNPEVKFTCNISHTAQEMMQQRLKELKIQISGGNIGFNFGHREGYSIFSQGSNNTLTAVYEKRLLKLEIRHNATISPELTSAVNDLPTIYDKHDQNNVQKWKTFFNGYGTHYINTSYVGGSVVFRMSHVDGSSGQSTFRSSQGGLSGFLKGIFGSVEYSDSSSSSSSSSFNRKNLEILVRGGNSAMASQLALSNNQKEFTDRLAAWEETIWENPMVTDSSVALAEVADVVNRFKPQVVNAMKTATEDLYNARLEYEAKLAEPTKQADSDANKDGGGNCLTPETLICTPTGSFPVMSIKAGDFVLDHHGRLVKVIGVNKVYSLGCTTLYGFKDSPIASKPFFTSGHTFVTPAGDILVQNKYYLENSHPQMKTEFNVVEMPSENIEAATFEDGVMKRRIVEGLTSTTANERQELYFLVVEGEGTYVANGFVCYHELPKFEAWPKTFATIFETVSHVEFPNGDKDFTLEQFSELAKVSEKIKIQWEVMVNNIGPAEDETNENGGESFQSVLNHLGLVLNDQYKSSFGMILYSRCGEFLHRHLDIQGMPILPFVKEARKILQAKN